MDFIRLTIIQSYSLILVLLLVCRMDTATSSIFGGVGSAGFALFMLAIKGTVGSGRRWWSEPWFGDLSSIRLLVFRGRSILCLFLLIPSVGFRWRALLLFGDLSVCYFHDLLVLQLCQFELLPFLF